VTLAELIAGDLSLAGILALLFGLWRRRRLRRRRGASDLEYFGD
jgi:hypothetical protein